MVSLESNLKNLNQIVKIKNEFNNDRQLDASENLNAIFWMAKQLQLKRLIRKSTVFELFLDFVQISNDLDHILTLLEEIFQKFGLLDQDEEYD